MSEYELILLWCRIQGVLLLLLLLSPIYLLVHYVAKGKTDGADMRGEDNV